MSGTRVAIDGGSGEGGGQVLRTALTLSAATGRPFEMVRVRERRPRAGLRPQHVAAVRAAALVTGARTSGVLEGSRELSFEPGAVEAGRYGFEIGTAGSAPLVLQTVLPALALHGRGSTVTVEGGTHVPNSPTFEFVASHWRAAVERLGFRFSARLVRAGFYPPGGGRVEAHALGFDPPAQPLALEERGALIAVRGVAGAVRVKGGVAERLRTSAAQRLWEDRRLEASWEDARLEATSPGATVFLEAEFEHGRAAFQELGERGVPAERLGDRAARRLLAFLDGEAAVDEHLADQLAAPLAVAGCGGRLSTPSVTTHLQTVAGVLEAFGYRASVWGRLGGPGGLALEPGLTPALSDG